MAQQTQVNGNRYSFTNVFVTLAGDPVPKGVFKSINYDAMQDPGIVQGNQVSIVGRTQGYGTSTGSFEMLVSELDDFFQVITLGGSFSAMAPFQDFDITVSYSVNGVDVRTDELIGCRITKIGSANQQGTDATTKTCDLSIARLILNGVQAFADNVI